MARSEIPAPWRKRVCAVLKEGAHGKQIQWTIDAAKRFESDSFGSWPFQGTDAVAAFLSTGKPLGCPVTMTDPPGETYEFIFPFGGRDFYGKILLMNDIKTIKVFSLHLPANLKLRCD